MLVIPGRSGHTCEGPTRRELLRAGSLGIFGLSLPQFLAWQGTAQANPKLEGGRGFGSAKSVMFIFLQGGPSHLDIWDPKPDAPANIRGRLTTVQQVMIISGLTLAFVVNYFLAQSAGSSLGDLGGREAWRWMYLAQAVPAATSHWKS